MRRTAVTLALVLSLCGVAAGQPAPVPALPDTQRLTQYSISASTCACSVGFALYGDGTDVDNWVQVFIGSTRYLSTDPTFGWTITSVSGSLGGIALPITNGVLTFNTAQTGTVSIVGARRPRRTSQFPNTGGIPNRSMNQVVTDEVAMLRESWDRLSRTIQGQPGEVLNLLPSAATRAGTIAGFDGSGQPIVYPPTTGVIAPGSITSSMLAAGVAAANLGAAGGDLTGTYPNPTIGANKVTGPAIAAGAVTPSKITAPGVDFNILNTQTANYSIQTTDCGNTVQAGTGSTGLFTITLPSVAGFASNCAVFVKNGDTARGKILSGFPANLNTILWPSQSVQVRIINGAWATATNPGRWFPTSAPTLNVNHASGSDTNNDCLGTVAGACATITHAIALLTGQIDCGAGEPTIQNAAETFTENVTVLGPPCGAGHSNLIHFVGSAGSPSTVVWQPSGANGIGLTCFDLAMCIINGFTCQSSASGQTCFQASKLGYVGVGNIVFGTVTAGFHMQCSLGGTINYETGTYTVSGSMNYHLFGTQNCNAQWFGVAVSVPNALTFTNWANVLAGASLNTTATFTGTGSAGGSTGTKYTATLNGTIALNGTTLPGATGGTTATGGQVSP